MKYLTFSFTLALPYIILKEVRGDCLLKNLLGPEKPPRAMVNTIGLLWPTDLSILLQKGMFVKYFKIIGQGLRPLNVHAYEGTHVNVQF